MKLKVRVKPRVEEPVSIREEYIKLDSFLKLVNVVGTGGEAKLRIQDGEVSVNGEVCTMRGKKLREGDTVRMAGRVWRVTHGEEA